MGGGGLLQLVSSGAQDVFLTGDPQVTFFKSMYRRYTNFAIEAIEQTSTGVTTPGGRMITTISRNGDLLHKLYLQVSLPATGMANASGDVTDKWAFVRNFAHVLIQEASVEIGGQVVDRIYGRFDNIWNSLTCKAEKKLGMLYMAGVDTDPVTSDQPLEFSRPVDLYIPLNFWFSKGSMGQALPLIALQFHEVKLEIHLAPVVDLIRRADAGGSAVSASSNGPGTFSQTPEQYVTNALSNGFIRMFADFVFLDTTERRRFAQASHEYLIEQLQTTGRKFTDPFTSSSDTSHIERTTLAFNHPCKAFYWAAYRPDAQKYTMWNPMYNGMIDPDAFPYGSTGDLRSGSNNNPIERVGLLLNNHERFSVRPGSYFTLVQSYQHHTTMPENNWVGLYSFCISPEEHQPSGSLNMSRVDNALLQLTFKNPRAELMDQTSANVYNPVDNDWPGYEFYVYAINYNILRILSGMGGLAFSN